MAIPKYQYIKDELKQKIISGQFENGDKFYTEAELIQMYDVSSITVVRALNDLANDGYIIRQQGKGTFVSRARKHKLVEFSDVEVFPSQSDHVTVLSIERGNDGAILDKLGLKSNQFYYRIERVRETNGVTYIYQQSYIPEQYVNANYPNLEYYSSIYGRFKADYHIHMNDEPFEEINEIVFPTPKHVAEKLGISQPAYASWERGIKKPTQENLVKIAQILNVSVDYLVGNSDYTEDKLDNIELLFRMNSKGLTDEEKEIFKKELIEFMKERKKLFNGKE